MTKPPFNRYHAAALAFIGVVGLLSGMSSCVGPSQVEAAPLPDHSAVVVPLPDHAAAKLMLDATGFSYLWNVAQQEHAAGVLSSEESTKLLALAADAQAQIKLSDAALDAADADEYKKSIAKAEADAYDIYDIVSAASKRPVKEHAPAATA